MKINLSLKWELKLLLKCILKRLDLDTLSYELRHKANNETSQQRKMKSLKRLQVVEAFREAQTNILKIDQSG